MSHNQARTTNISNVGFQLFVVLCSPRAEPLTSNLTIYTPKPKLCLEYPNYLHLGGVVSDQLGLFPVVLRCGCPRCSITGTAKSGLVTSSCA